MSVFTSRVTGALAAEPPSRLRAESRPSRGGARHRRRPSAGSGVGCHLGVEEALLRQVEDELARPELERRPARRLAEAVAQPVVFGASSSGLPGASNSRSICLACATGLPTSTPRLARHLRNAIAQATSRRDSRCESRIRLSRSFSDGGRVDGMLRARGCDVSVVVSVVVSSAYARAADAPARAARPSTSPERTGLRLIAIAPALPRRRPGGSAKLLSPHICIYLSKVRIS
jgi:hypothetical protein